MKKVVISGQKIDFLILLSLLTQKQKDELTFSFLLNINPSSGDSESETQHIFIDDQSQALQKIRYQLNQSKVTPNSVSAYVGSALPKRSIGTSRPLLTNANIFSYQAVDSVRNDIDNQSAQFDMTHQNEQDFFSLSDIEVDKTLRYLLQKHKYTITPVTAYLTKQVGNTVDISIDKTICLHADIFINLSTHDALNSEAAANYLLEGDSLHLCNNKNIIPSATQVETTITTASVAHYWQNQTIHVKSASYPLLSLPSSIFLKIKQLEYALTLICAKNINQWVISNYNRFCSALILEDMNSQNMLAHLNKQSDKLNPDNTHRLSLYRATQAIPPPPDHATLNELQWYEIYNFFNVIPKNKLLTSNNISKTQRDELSATLRVKA